MAALKWHNKELDVSLWYLLMHVICNSWPLYNAVGTFSVMSLHCSYCHIFLYLSDIFANCFPIQPLFPVVYSCVHWYINSQQCSACTHGNRFLEMHPNTLLVTFAYCFPYMYCFKLVLSLWSNYTNCFSLYILLNYCSLCSTLLCS